MKVMSFKLEVRAPGQEDISRYHYQTQEALRADVKTLFKRNFVGSAIPYVWNSELGDWEEFLAVFPQPQNGEEEAFFSRKRICLAASQLLKTLAEKPVWSPSSKDEVIELLTSVLALAEAPMSEQEEAMFLP